MGRVLPLVTGQRRGLSEREPRGFSLRGFDEESADVAEAEPDAAPGVTGRAIVPTVAGIASVVAWGGAWVATALAGWAVAWVVACVVGVVGDAAAAAGFGFDV
jgi:hypothetical protein